METANDVNSIVVTPAAVVVETTNVDTVPEGGQKGLSTSTSDLSSPLTETIQLRVEKKASDAHVGGHLTVHNPTSLLNVTKTDNDADRPHSAIITNNERIAYSKNDKSSPRPASEQATDGVHPNAVKDPNNFCVVCGKRVYQLEKITAHKGVYHKTCFRCGVCEKVLAPGNFSVLDGHLFCKPHLIQQFKTRGKYETSAAFKAREAGASRTSAEGTENAAVSDVAKKV